MIEVTVDIENLEDVKEAIDKADILYEAKQYNMEAL